MQKPTLLMLLALCLMLAACGGNSAESGQPAPFVIKEMNIQLQLGPGQTAEVIENPMMPSQKGVSVRFGGRRVLVLQPQMEIATERQLLAQFPDSLTKVVRKDAFPNAFGYVLQVDTVQVPSYLLTLGEQLWLVRHALDYRSADLDEAVRVVKSADLPK